MVFQYIWKWDFAKFLQYLTAQILTSLELDIIKWQNYVNKSFRSKKISQPVSLTNKFS